MTPTFLFTNTSAKLRRVTDRVSAALIETHSRALAFARALYDRLGEHEVFGRGAQVAFYFLIAVFPLLLAAVGMLSTLHLSAYIATLEDFLTRGLPPGVAALLLNEVHQLSARTGWPLVFTLVVTAYYGGNGATTVLRGVARAFAIDRRILILQLLGLGFAGLFVLLLPLVLMLLTAATWLVMWGSATGFLPAPIAYLVSLLRWPLMFLLFQQLVNGVYRLGGAPVVTWGWFSWGSAFSTFAWIVITFGFELYVKTVANLGATYGSLGTVVGLLLYAHIVSICVLLGAEIEAERLSARGRSH